jgi:ATP-binding cassette subfamily C protein
MGRVRGAVELAGVTYRHRENGEGGTAGGLEGVDLAIDHGSFVGITGPSGAGKTTFADLVAGLYPPQEGVVRAEGRTLEGDHLSAWRESISYVSQDPFLFHDTVRRNLLWARPEAGEEQLWAALRLAGAETLVRRMPLGLDSLVGERGTLVSGGERQRIALARAFLRRPSLLLLDEATNAIDIEGERAILLSLRQASDRPTIIMIAHREASLEGCERVIRFSHGRIE